jgi:hypothetical protein
LSPIDVARLVDVATRRQIVAGRARTMRQRQTPTEHDGKTLNELRASTHQPSRKCSGEFMKISKSFIATAVIAVLPLVAFGGDKDKTPAPTGTAASAQFDTLDANRDGRISREEAAIDSKIKFSTADKNGDGYLDNSEYSNRDMSNDSSMPEKSPQ